MGRAIEKRLLGARAPRRVGSLLVLRDDHALERGLAEVHGLDVAGRRRAGGAAGEEGARREEPRSLRQAMKTLFALFFFFFEK